jgi:alginate O-acetyltransferase complex protein AlgI
MLFSSPEFFLFFLCYLGAHLATPRRYRLAVIIIGGTIFYSYWNPYYVWVPYLLIFIAYLGAIWVMAEERDSQRRLRLACAAGVLLLPLLVFKYTNFVYSTLFPGLAKESGALLNIPLPLGISFVTFTLVAYLVDVHRLRFPVEKRLGTLAGYVVFFPHLIAGPILRPRDLIPQIVAAHPFRVRAAKVGLAIFAVGLLKKLVIADQIAPYVDRVYANPASQTSLDFLLAIYGFSAQIYCDFSGYTDMAIGLALILGIRLPTNFMQPYTARSVAEFWRRWHITLSRWLRDYLYIPLGGNKAGFSLQLRNIMITMTLGGLWHGANWTFVIWGALHGAAICFSHALRRAGISVGSGRGTRWLLLLVTFHFVAAAWIFFRAPNFGTALEVLSGPFTGSLPDLAAFLLASAFPLALLSVFFATHAYDDHRRVAWFARRAPGGMFWAFVIGAFLLSAVISSGSSAKFIYFDF